MLSLCGLIREALDPVKEERRVQKKVAETLTTTVEGFTTLKATAPLLEPGDEPLLPEFEQELEQEAAEDQRQRMQENEFPDNSDDEDSVVG